MPEPLPEVMRKSVRRALPVDARNAVPENTRKAAPETAASPQHSAHTRLCVLAPGIAG